MVIDDGLTVTDMLAAVLNIFTQEELNESAEEPTSNVVPVNCDRAERREVIKNKILAFSHMFSVLQYATCHVVRSILITLLVLLVDASYRNRLRSRTSIDGSISICTCWPASLELDWPTCTGWGCEMCVSAP